MKTNQQNLLQVLNFDYNGNQRFICGVRQLNTNFVGQQHLFPSFFHSTAYLSVAQMVTIVPEAHKEPFEIAIL